ncbi:acyltransferase family protein [Frondihabitans australicus]|uniref:Peptidoglycan/LPS O-acetylase OafA/YrhL n=1 Tax=Frondihabitans australicus TaxID=386892 RepID=A0A495INE4_9MICO|nr:acyltransferase [Frondihabitans australicus]RKR76645.1 peptidoglycan/LPS O-acetylase OafA/YrhL [Frondihabitans australicus]
MATTTTLTAPSPAPARSGAASAESGASTRPAQAAGSRLPALDGVRTLAILGVVLYHFHVPHFNGGFVGVNVFFVLSGYLITSLLLKEHVRSNTINLARFWARRVLRLYPTLIVVVAVGASLWFLVGDDGTTKNLSAGGAALIALTYTGNFARAFGHISQGIFAPSWSLAMEEQFYLVWPPVLALALFVGLRRRTIAWTLAGLVVVSCALGWLLYTTPNSGATADIYFSPVANVAPLLSGCILALALQSAGARRLFASRFGQVATWVGAAYIVAVMFSITSGDWNQHAPFFGMILPSIGVAAAFMVGGLVSRPTLVSRVLALKPMAWFGANVSYSLYLWHVLVMSLLLPYFPGLGGTFAVIAIAVGVAILSHFVVEKPFLVVKRRFEPKSWSRPAAGQAQARQAQPAAKQAVAGQATVSS